MSRYGSRQTSKRGAVRAAQQARGKAAAQRARNDVTGRPAHRWCGDGQRGGAGCVVTAVTGIAVTVLRMRGWM